MTQRNYGEAPPHGRPRLPPFSMVLIGSCRVHRLWPAAGQHTPFLEGLLAGLEEGEGKQDAPERRVAAQADGRIQPLGFGLRPAPTASEGLQAPKTPATSSLPKKAASSVCSPAPPLWLFPSHLPAGLFFVSLTGFSYFSPLHWSTGPCFLSFPTPPPRSMESTTIHQPLGASLHSGALDVQHRLPPGKQLCSPLYHQRGYPLNIYGNISLGP